jgi:predicted DNA-binding protein (UPF0251 family)
MPQVKYFKPAGIPLKQLEEECLSLEEIEAVRLKDLEGLEQEQGAERMNVSRPTFQRILASARQKIAAALIQGKAIKIEGGSFERPPCHFTCSRGHEWDVPFDNIADSRPSICPTCRTSEITCSHQPGKDCGARGHLRCCQIEQLALEKTEKE